MKSRIERYYDEDSDIPTRSSRNKELYDNIGNEKPLIKTEIEIEKNEIDISNIKNKITNREEYQQIKGYQEIVKTTETKEDSEVFDYEKEAEEDKVYDINSILENAKASREKLDVEQKYKRLKNTSYDILSNLDLGMKDEEEQNIELELDKEIELKQDTKEVVVPPKHRTQEEELRELIDTITMKKILEDEGDLEKELLQDFSPNDEVVPKGIFDVIERTEEEKRNDRDTAKEIDDQLQRTLRELKEEQIEKEIVAAKTDDDEDFFTNSYKFSKKDFKKKNVKEKNKGVGLGIKLLIVLLIIVIILVFLYLINIFILV